MIELRGYQSDAVGAVLDAWQSGVQRPLVSLFTGAGKTVVVAKVLQERAPTRGRALVLAHHEELLHQAKAKLEMVWPGVSVGMLKAGECDLDGDVTVASVASAVRPDKLEQLKRMGYGTVVVDEAHHGVAPTYVKILEELGAFSWPGPGVLGVTATPARADKKRMGDVWDRVVIERTLPWGIREGYACDLGSRKMPVEGLEGLEEIATRGGDFAPHKLFGVIEASAMAESVGRGWEYLHAEGVAKKSLVFCTTIFEAARTQAALERHGARAAVVLGQEDGARRQETLSRFSDGELDVLVNCGVLLEGYDEPQIDCLFMARPTRSHPLFLQMIGRGVRRHPGKDMCLVIDPKPVVAGVAVGFQFNGFMPLVCVDDVFGTKLGETVLSAAERQEKEQAVANHSGHGKPRERFAVHWVHDRGRWIATGEGMYLVLRPLGVEWEVWRVPQRSNGEMPSPHPYSHDSKPEKLAGGLDLGYAQGVVEDAVRKNGALGMAGLPWRDQPASPRQEAAMRKMGIWGEGITTKGDASDVWAAWEVNKALSGGSNG